MNAVVGDVRGKNVLLVDDLIASGGSLATAADFLKTAGAEDIYVCATHAVMCSNAFEILSKAPIKKVIVTDTVPCHEPNPPDSYEIVSVAALLGEAIKRIHMNMSVSHLFKDGEL